MKQPCCSLFNYLNNNILCNVNTLTYRSPNAIQRFARIEHCQPKKCVSQTCYSRPVPLEPFNSFYKFYERSVNYSPCSYYFGLLRGNVLRVTSTLTQMATCFLGANMSLARRRRHIVFKGSNSSQSTIVLVIIRNAAFQILSHAEWNKAGSNAAGAALIRGLTSDVCFANDNDK